MQGLKSLRENLLWGERKAGPSTTLRSSRVDKSVAQPRLWTNEKLSSRPERSEVEGPAVRPSP